VRGRTVILVTHRPATAAAADEVHVMAAGRIVESGSHDALVARGGRYARLWNRAEPAARVVI
jgi:ATP-binding cassette subfamily B protein